VPVGGRTLANDERELKQKYADLLAVYGAVPEDVRYFAERMGLAVRAVRRDLKDFVGPLLGTRWELRELEIGCEEESKDYVTGDITTERKVVRIPVSALTNFEFILETRVRKGEKK